MIWSWNWLFFILRLQIRNGICFCFAYSMHNLSQFPIEWNMNLLNALNNNWKIQRSFNFFIFSTFHCGRQKLIILLLTLNLLPLKPLKWVSEVQSKSVFNFRSITFETRNIWVPFTAFKSIHQTKKKKKINK